MSFAQATQPQDASAPVPCGQLHTAQTVRVGDLSSVTNGDTDVTSAAVRARVSQACPDRLLRFVGGSQEARRLSRFEVVWFTPTPDQVKAGARWFRCDVVGLAAANQLIPLRSTLKGALDQSSGLDRFGTCGTRAPGKLGFQRVVCRRPHSWRAVATVDLPRTARYLGAAASAQADAACKNVAAARSSGALKYTWSFEWPPRADWATGQRYGYCWVPG
ncbi:MAG: septum formation family protein [Marmoricola sp.]|nr:septum formation family protein [Marmoricola sp.]